MSTSDSIGKKAANGFVKFLVALAMFLVLFVIMILVLGTAVFDFLNVDLKATRALVLGIVLSTIYGIVVFVIPYFRKSGTIRWFGICAFGDAAWWAYLLITD